MCPGRPRPRRRNSIAWWVGARTGLVSVPPFRRCTAKYCFQVTFGGVGGRSRYLYSSSLRRCTGLGCQAFRLGHFARIPGSLGQRARRCNRPAFRPSLLSPLLSRGPARSPGGGPRYDVALKKILRHYPMMELLIRRYIPEFRDRIGFRSLDTQNTELIGTGFAERYADLLWLAELKDEDCGLVLSIEFQRRPERARPAPLPPSQATSARLFVRHSDPFWRTNPVPVLTTARPTRVTYRLFRAFSWHSSSRFIRLKYGLLPNHREIARALGVFNSTVSGYAGRARRGRLLTVVARRSWAKPRTGVALSLAPALPQVPRRQPTETGAIFIAVEQPRLPASESSRCGSAQSAVVCTVYPEA